MQSIPVTPVSRITTLTPPEHKHIHQMDKNSLPDGPLAAIIQHLPWQDRVQVERVSGDE